MGNNKKERRVRVRYCLQEVSRLDSRGLLKVRSSCPCEDGGEVRVRVVGELAPWRIAVELGRW